ncbi:anthranilate synthase component I [Paracoccidioides brasiliensis]|uniref:anthranilate synthase n=1 Tax=Paracoccidioides brasiliensis TaxID=121759 RepID=A0A1D2J591_PARBR|nr:anthranilate synthase component I [Paracoccidioides brasiliensis]
MAPRVIIQPSIEVVKDVLAQSKDAPHPPNLVPLMASVPADLLTPTLAYLKLSANSKLSFLYESAATTETIGRYTFVGAGMSSSTRRQPLVDHPDIRQTKLTLTIPPQQTDPKKVIKTGPGYGPECDPLPALQEELSQSLVATIPGLILPPMAGGAIGYVSYDCVRYFEPKTARPMKDILKIPESFFMMVDTIVAFDHFFQVVKVITYVHLPEDEKDFEAEYQKGQRVIQRTIDVLLDPKTPLPHQPPITEGQKYTSNIGQAGYEAHVRKLKEHIMKGDIFQTVPSQRLARPTSLHPFNLYRHLRTVNPSPYLFYIDCDEFQLIGASPELLVKEEGRRIITHPIAGTVKRGKTPQEDAQLAADLLNSEKDRAEHVMLVDLARNDVNRVCDPETTHVDRLLVVEKFSHVQHLVSQVSGILRPDKTRFDAFRSIFPAGTVSGAPKVRAMELIAELEGEKRGVYAGAVGYFGYNYASGDGREIVDGPMDTCIALRTMMVKDGVAYLQAGGGIVFDSDPYDEYVETLNKLGANIQCIKSAEERYLAEQAEAAKEVSVV